MTVTAAEGPEPRVRQVREGFDGRGLPWGVEPRGDRTVRGLVDWLRADPEGVADGLRTHGALLMRGFDVRGPEDFERVARAIDGRLQNEYLGTSPRNALTEYVFSASELPGFYPIPEHCEMSFLREPPRRLFFCCLEAPARGGETPLVDFRAVARDLDRDVARRFEEGGIRIIRNYEGPEGARRIDPWKLKRWDEIFLTTDRQRVEVKCREQGFEPEWLPGGRLRLISEQPAFRDHPETGERVWFNHVQVFHLSSGPSELRRIVRRHPGRRRPDPGLVAFYLFARAVVAVRARLAPPESQPMHCTYRDGREIPLADLEHVRDVIWRHMVAFPWRRGDVVAIDNLSIAHGRLPYRGPRSIAVAWA